MLLSPVTGAEDNAVLLLPSIGLRRGEVATEEALEEELLLLRRGLAGVWYDGGPGDPPAPAPQPDDTPRALSAPKRDPNAAPNDVRRGGSFAVRGVCCCCCCDAAVDVLASPLCPGDMVFDWCG